VYLVTSYSCFEVMNQNDIRVIQDNLKDLVEKGKSQRRLEGNDDPVPIMITKAGYPSETHVVETDDGYILQVHRIPRGRHNSSSIAGERRPVVFLQHGLEGDSSNWVISYDYPEKSLGFILADAGYDVWLGNYRGNVYSRSHITLDPEELPFWLFSWDEMARYDLPAMINKAIETTKEEKIFYIGHSMGTTGVMAMVNYHPEMNEKIILASLLAPVAFVENMRSPIALLAPIADSFEEVLERLGIGEFFPSNKLMDLLAEYVCDEEYYPTYCENIVFLLMGFDKAQTNETLLDTILHHSPAGTSARAVVHYAQEINSGRFSRYDHGKDNNLEIYGTHPPPAYELSKVTFPVAAYWGDNDWLAGPEDVQRCTSGLPNLFSSYEVPYPKWNHLDFLWAIDADKLLYAEVLKNMDIFKQQNMN